MRSRTLGSAVVARLLLAPAPEPGLEHPGRERRIRLPSCPRQHLPHEVSEKALFPPAVLAHLPGTRREDRGDDGLQTLRVTYLKKVEPSDDLRRLPALPGQHGQHLGSRAARYRLPVHERHEPGQLRSPEWEMLQRAAVPDTGELVDDQFASWTPLSGPRPGSGYASAAASR